MSGIVLFLASFLASAIESVEMMAIVVGVGATRGWRSALIGAVTGLVVLAALVIGLGTALKAIPIHWLRLVVGALLLVFGLQWLKKGIYRIARPRPKKSGRSNIDSAPQSNTAIDWYAFVLAFKGVLLEGLEIAFVVISFGAEARQIGLASLGAAAAFLLIAGVAFFIRGMLSRIPREWLRFAVGILLTTFGTFWAAEGAGIKWPAEDGALLILLATFTAVAFAGLGLLRKGTAERHRSPQIA